MNIIHADPTKGIIEAEFSTRAEFHNHVGNIQGGILVAMLDDLMGYALGITLPVDQFAPTANLNASFLRSVSSGKIIGKGQVLKVDGVLAHMAAKLFNEQNEILASATCKAKISAI